ncbi:MAG TPA: SDR family oxidoreductase [Bacillota bacterium]|nr:SDR family oxidoreductase [Bacillota bacterium]HOK68603.1 SDR family oxidoreductase [Bacillota bacterium]HPP84793.1 SDR family oxidoreductase [Bacillota bacterium]
MSQIVVITGASSGIGLCTGSLFADKGYKVYSLSRSCPPGSRLFHIPTDVSSEPSVQNAIEQIIRAEGKIDILINNAGFGISGAAETTLLEDAKRQFDVNFFGMFLCVKYALPYMRAAKQGKIINVSSVAAVLPVPYQSFYSCAKSAVNAFTLTLANEVRPFGISVAAVMPGDIKTGFTGARKKNPTTDEAYREREERAVFRMEKDEQNGMAPSAVARCIYKAATKKHPKPLYTVGFQYKTLVTLAKFLPVSVVNKIEGKMYG